MPTKKGIEEIRKALKNRTRKRERAPETKKEDETEEQSSPSLITKEVTVHYGDGSYKTFKLISD